MNPHTALASFLLAVSVVTSGLCEEKKPTRLLVTPCEVLADSVRIAPLPATTNVYFNFQYKDKPPEAIKEILRQHLRKRVMITGDTTNASEGLLQGALSSNNVPVGLVLSFATRKEAEQARDCLRVNLRP